MTDKSPNVIYSEHQYGVNNKFNRNAGRENEQASYLMWCRQLTNLAISRFKWTGMPPTVDLRFLELTLFYHGLSVFYKNHDLDAFLAVQGSATGYMNYLQNPVSFNIITAGQDFAGDKTQQIQSPAFLSAYNPATNYDLIPDKDAKDTAIPIWANAMRQPDVDVVTIYARRFAMLDRTIEINTMSARRPKVLKANQLTVLTMQNIKNQIDGGADFVVVKADSGGMPTDDMEVLDFGIDAKQITELSLLKARWWNECMGLFGIDNSNQDKKERLVSSEVDANNGQTDSFRNIQLQSRRQACEWIKEVHGLDVKVEFNIEVEAMARQIASQNGVGGENSGNVHDGAESGN